ncbi:dihydrolipoyl dehydrogenase [Novosphingobium terrae]|uniref:dihydrolipoyl dehydrogenase n=1 Tax=Novosphingobium terrae TaxID=2726189 RepID=UPI00197D46B3|nr:dihydrolipoyl dehydrogenase [Novosphingobium terrae]
MDLSCDVAIIGAGTAGLSAERSARRAGARTLIIDPEFSGTTCANVGCMPSKLLIAAADAAYAVRQAPLFGIAANSQVSGHGVMQRLRRERDHFSAATREDIAKIPASSMLRGKARFVNADTLLIDDGTRVTARAIVIATGSRPAMPDNFAALGDLALTNETLFELDTLPETLAVIGAGPLGLELAQAMARLGVKVTLLDEASKLAGLEDKAIASRLDEVLRRDMAVVTGVKIAAETRDGKVRLRWTGRSSGEGLFDRVLVATGRPPALKGLDLEKSGLALDKLGVPRFDRDTLRCGESPIFIAGDADADRPVLHEASAQGALAGYNAARCPDVTPGKRNVPFSIMFTDPALATVGQVQGEDLVVGTADYSDQGRARIEAKAVGLAHLHADPADGRLLGAILLCPGAEHLAHLLAWSIESGMTASALLERPFYHPTLEEGLKPALRMICKTVGSDAPGSSDEGHPSGG